MRSLYFLTDLLNVSRALVIRWKEGARSQVCSFQMRFLPLTEANFG